MNKKKFICVRCPRGCEILTTLDGYTITSIEGNVCKMGTEYVQDEVTSPKRIITSTIKVKDGELPLVPVWTSDVIPKDKIFDLMELLRDTTITAPVKINQVIMKNILDLNIDILASGNVNKE